MNKFCYDHFSFPRKYARAVFNKMFHKKLLKQAGCAASAKIKDIQINIHPGVFNPSLFISGKHYAGMLDELLKAGKYDHVLDMGTGSGIGALIAAKYANRVHAVDIDSKAVACAQENIYKSGNRSKIQVYQGDLFEPVTECVYDVILFNPPFIAKMPLSDDGRALYGGNDLEVVERFFIKAKAHLTPKGVIYFLCSTEGQNDMIFSFIQKFRYGFELAGTRDAIIERLFLYRIKPEY